MKLKKSDLQKIIRQEIKKIHEEDTLEESTFVAAYNGVNGVFVHEFKAKDIKDALQRFIDIYKIPKSDVNNIKIKKTNKSIFRFF